MHVLGCHKISGKWSILNISVVLSVTVGLALFLTQLFPIAASSLDAALAAPNGMVSNRVQVAEQQPHRIIIKTQDELAEPFVPTGYASFDAAMDRFDVRAVVPLFDASDGDVGLKHELGLSRWYVLTLASSTDLQDALTAFSADPAVEYVEPDYIGYGAGIPDDQWFSYQWNLHNTGQSGGDPDADVDAPEAWDISTGVTSTVLAVIDTGVDLDHPDLVGKIVSGYDFVSDTVTAQDDHGHGTHVAGIAAAVTNNAIGAAGVCPECRVMPLKALNSENWGYYSWWISAIEYAVDHGAHAINMSMGGTDYSQALHDAVLYAYNANVPIVAAMMNDGDSTFYYPAAFTETIAVGATDRYDDRWSDSNFGDHIDLVAPGAAILSTKWNDTYAIWDGTSMAVPHVVGALGLIHSVRPGYTVEELRMILRATAEDQVGPSNEDQAGWDQYFGAGRLNVAQAVQYVAPPVEAIIDGPTAGIISVDYTFTAIVSPLTAVQPITFVWQATGQAPIVHTGGLSDVVTFAWPTPGVQTITVTAANFGGMVTSTHAVAIAPPPPVTELTVCLGGGCDYDNIQDAVDAISDGGVIRVATGVYTSINRYGGLAQVVYISKSVTIQGGYALDFADPPDPDTNLTTVDAQGGGRAFYIAGNISPTVEGLRITGGDATGLVGGLGGGNSGGGICVVNATAVISNNWIFSNTARWGGGLYVEKSGAVLVGNTFVSNTAKKDGGGLYLQASNATLNENTVASNIASEQGGGLYLYESAAVLGRNAVTANTAGKGGGGLYLWRSGANLDGNAIIANAAAEEGGGLYLGNSDAALTNNVVAGNQAGIAGSGIYIRGSAPSLLHTTIARNGGSGICVTGDAEDYSAVVMTNTILVGHTVGITVASGSTSTLEATLWGEGAWGNTVDWDGAGTIALFHNYWGTPAFAAPDAENYHIRADSAARDVGVDAPVVTDMDGDPRPVGVGYDIGADESPVGLVVGQQASSSPVRAGAQLTYTIRVANTGNVYLHAIITDTLPDHVTPGGVSTWAPVAIAPGSVWTEMSVVTVEVDYTGPLTNVVQVTTEEGATSVSTEQILAFAPRLVVSVRPSAHVVTTGARLTYTIYVTNLSPVDLQATITDLLPERVIPGDPRTWMPTIAASGGVWMENVAVAVEQGYTGLLTNVVQVVVGEGVMALDTSVVNVVEELVTVGPSEGGTIVAAAPDGMAIIIEIPPNAVSESTQLAYTSLSVVTGFHPDLVFAGRAFKLEAYRDGDVCSGLVFGKPLTVTIHYTQADVTGLDEDTLGLRYWDSSAWSADGIETEEKDTTAKRLVTRIEHLSEFAMFAQRQQSEGTHEVYLPLVLCGT